MGSKWRKAKMALSCLYVPSSTEDSNRIGGRLSDAALLSPSPSSVASRNSDVSMPNTPMPSSAGLLLPKHSSKSSKKTCAICLTTMKAGQGHAIFTAECSHSFHFHCITSNVKHGNQICPICRAKWREVPLKSPASSLSHRKSRANVGGLHQDDSWTTVFSRSPAPRADSNRRISSFYHTPPEPATFDDDEYVDDLSEISETSLSKKTDIHDHSRGAALEIKTYPEVSAISRSASQKDFNVLIHLKALTSRIHKSEKNVNNARAPVDLVTVLDVSGSMAGTKLALLKRAMGFVIQHLGPSDRLSVIAFSSTARRVFSLRRMTDNGKQEALQAVNSLLSSGGTNIAEGLRKGAKVVTERKWKNPVTSIILLSDGQDTYTISSPGGKVQPKADYHSLIPSSIHHDSGSGIHIPVHAFGFGSDHDAALMHSVSEASGGTFSFIETENVIQDAFAQCIGGLLSVVLQELNLKIESVNSRIKLGSVKSGSYKSRVNPDSRTGFISVGDLYADEERDFLVEVDIPADGSSENTTLLKISYSYKDPMTNEVVNLDEPNKVEIERPTATGKMLVSMEVDRQRNRVTAAEAIAKARSAAEQGDLSVAVSVLEGCRKEMSKSISAQAGDKLCMGLCSELKEMQERMASRQVYETSGRAYVLSGLSSHSWQRATARGDSTDSTTLLQSYQTPTMVDMVSRSQTMYLGTPSSSSSSWSSSSQNRLLRQSLSFPAGRPQPR